MISLRIVTYLPLYYTGVVWQIGTNVGPFDSYEYTQPDKKAHDKSSMDKILYSHHICALNLLLGRCWCVCAARRRESRVNSEWVENIGKNMHIFGTILIWAVSKTPKM